MSLAPADAPETVARVREGMPLVDLLAHQVRREIGVVQIDDLRSAGHEALLQAARSFDPSLGVPFRRWVNVRVRGAMLDSIRSQGGIPRRIYNRLRALEAGDRMSEAAAEEDAQGPPSSATEADARLSSYLAGIVTAMALGLLAQPVSGPDGDDALSNEDSPDEAVAREQMMARVREAIALQPEAERHLLTRHYFDGLQFDDAAKELGLSKSWASRLHARAIEGVARELKRKRITP
jgi:RNA polymerase sigma factor for flagellar operon FliA